MERMQDIVSDMVTSAANMVKMKLPDFFVCLADQAHFTNSDEVGKRWFKLWIDSGYSGLPQVAKELIVQCIPFACPTCGRTDSCPHFH